MDTVTSNFELFLYYHTKVGQPAMHQRNLLFRYIPIYIMNSKEIRRIRLDLLY